MKKLVTLVLATCIAVAALAQPAGGHRHEGAKPDFEKIKAERIAFITQQVGLTPEEAQAFWPVYNKIEAEQRDLQKAEMEAYKALTKAQAEGGKVDALLDNYLKAKEANVNLHVKHAKDYKKVLSADKLAKFYAGEEKFRREQIGRLRGGAGPMGAGMTGGHGGHRGMMGGHGSKHEFKGEKGAI